MIKNNPGNMNKSKKTDIISIIEQIAIREDFEFCDDASERSLECPHVCGYKKIPGIDMGETFVGKVRFVDAAGKFKASVDDSVIEALGEYNDKN